MTAIVIRFREETQKATEAIREQTKATSLADEGFARLNRSFQGFAAGYLGFSAIVGQTKEIVDASVKFDTLNNPNALAARTRKEARTIEEAWLSDNEKCIFNITHLNLREALS